MSQWTSPRCRCRRPRKWTKRRCWPTPTACAARRGSWHEARRRQRHRIRRDFHGGARPRAAGEQADGTAAPPFRDRGSRLETPSDSAQVADTLVAIAQARGWDDIRVSGSTAFCREVWLEAAAHGMHVRGYTPSRDDRAELARRRHDPPRATTPAEPDPLCAAIDAIERQAAADGLTAEQRAVVMARVQRRAHHHSTQELATPMNRTDPTHAREMTR
ncbi:LPD7 domain-containing protein [Pseudoduganella chitinolytica]|uniref:Large polyvalent protein-associated domain-containing protein n=1 Tax=Pseudoduganella chitinolytica TaxID=34070 RepID=A0ABY8BNN5_9BURK|nr:LPD7 domain-containing protein [Pseudoduganella chitinolytica]WEF35959.1 hypothetical protein PX653_18595 [Pseudoduganella chitinolytica]